MILNTKEKNIFDKMMMIYNQNKELIDNGAVTPQIVGCVQNFIYSCEQNPFEQNALAGDYFKSLKMYLDIASSAAVNRKSSYRRFEAQIPMFLKACGDCKTIDIIDETQPLVEEVECVNEIKEETVVTHAQNETALEHDNLTNETENILVEEKRSTRKTKKSIDNGGIFPWLTREGE